MRQILLNSTGAIVARMPAPATESGSVLVRAKYSLISAGTEVASLTPSSRLAADENHVARARAYGNLAQSYLGKAIRDPRLAMKRLGTIARQRSFARMSRDTHKEVAPLPMPSVNWINVGNGTLETNGESAGIVTDASEYGYQVISQDFLIPQGHAPTLEIKGEVVEGNMCIGFLGGRHGNWIGFTTLEPGKFDERLVYDNVDLSEATLVISNAGTKSPGRLNITDARVFMTPPDDSGLSRNEMGQQGWNVGYSLAGEVVGVGSGVNDIYIGDLVACAGAGQANHAEYVSVKRNLVSRIPDGCDLKWAATTTVGAIALQGVRRAAPQLGETVAVIGLGLIGQISVQLLRASGCRVYGIDLSKHRVDRAIRLGMDGGTTDSVLFSQLIRDRTNNQGIDRTLVTAATSSSEPINQAMEITRAKGTVVIVGDVGLKVERSQFYRKEIDLLMSTSYGPGRYDRNYEVEGIDYPYPYVRWTQNRNMASYMDLITSGRLDIESLIDETVPIDDAHAAYDKFVSGAEPKPLGVLISYPDLPENLAEAGSSTVITLRGHRKPRNELINYVLVGAGAFGTSMLVPQMDKRKDRYFLKAVVSRDSVRGGNFARSRNCEILASELEHVVNNPEIHMAVIATRHDKHAEQAITALRSGVHVFVEKPLALSWDELDRIVATYEELEAPPLFMVGFNRRFAPAVQTLKEELAERRSPLITNYRLNGGYISGDSWIQGPEGGGRNIGEACHMYDVFRFLAGSPVASINVASIDAHDSSYFRNDNFCATLGYADGSVGNLVYTALGPRGGMPKERIEIFADGEAYIVDDFKSLTRASDGHVLWSGDADKGHQEELSRVGDSIANGGAPPIPFGEIIETSAVSLEIEDRIRDAH